MLFRVGIENNTEVGSIAWVLNHPGCFAHGANSDLAQGNLTAAAQNYLDWIAKNDADPWLTPGDFEMRVEETWEAYQINDEFELVEEGYEINAWFLHDWKPLTEEDIQRGLKMLAWSRADLLEMVRDLSHEDLKQRYPEERWNIAGILKHTGGAEWWYLDRLGLAFPRPEVPADAFERLKKVRAHLVKVLPDLVASRQVVGIDGEFWSPRKMLRRALWHEKDHTDHIKKLLANPDYSV